MCQVTDAQVGAPVSLSTLSSKVRKRLDEIVKFDSLTELTDSDRALLWLTRHNFIEDPSVLPKLLSCVEWENPQKAAEGHRKYSFVKHIHHIQMHVFVLKCGHFIVIFSIHFDHLVFDLTQMIVDFISRSKCVYRLSELYICRYDVFMGASNQSIGGVSAVGRNVP